MNYDRNKKKQAEPAAGKGMAMDIVKIGILGVIGVLIALQFKTQKQEYGFYIGFVVCLIIFSYVVSKLGNVWDSIQYLQDYMSADRSYFSILFKVVGITYVCEFCASICKDAGYSAIAGQIEIFGKLSVLLTGMPILLAIIENISAFAGS